jgi:CRISPR/Cas system-associated protein endoribonuclease Cas2
MRVIVLGMSRNITLLNIAIERGAFLLFIHDVTYSNLDLDTSYPQAVHQSSRQIPGYHLKLGHNCVQFTVYYRLMIYSLSFQKHRQTSHNIKFMTADIYKLHLLYKSNTILSYRLLSSSALYLVDYMQCMTVTTFLSDE